MKRTEYTLFAVPRTVGLALLAMLVVALFWATAAQAQTPAADQYKGPAAVAGSSQSGGGTGGGSGGSGSGGAKAAGATVNRLPATGGPSFLAYAGVVAGAGAGLMLLRSARGR